MRDIAGHGFSTEKDLIAAVFDAPDIPSVERRLVSLAEQIEQPRGMIRWHAARGALSLALLPTLMWVLCFVFLGT
jgi:hypothetical protein